MIFLVSGVVSAELLDCGSHLLEKVEVQADRDDGHSHNNLLLLKLSGYECNGKPFVYLDQSHQMFDAMMSIALSAKVSGKRVNVHVNSSTTNGSASQLSILRLAD
jgi:hypothetical protein